MVATWNAIPAMMILLPALRSFTLVFPPRRRHPPPAACRMSDPMSQPMKIQVNRRGCRRECSRAQREDDVLEGEVDAGRDEGGRRRRTHDLQLEGVFVPRVVMHEDPSDVPGHLEKAAHHQRDHQRPRPEVHADAELRQPQHAIKDREEDIAAEVWVVAVCGGFDGTRSNFLQVL